MSLEQAKKAGISEREYHEIMTEMHDDLDRARLNESLLEEYIDRIERISEGRIRLIKYKS